MGSERRPAIVDIDGLVADVRHLTTWRRADRVGAQKAP
jgi:hypothetical protein